MITFRFNEDNKKLLEEETGIPYDRLVSNTIEQSMKEVKHTKKSKIKIPEQTSRTIYLEFKRILSMNKINKYLSKL